MGKEHPVDVGHRSEIAVLHHLTERGYTVLLPSGFNQRVYVVPVAEAARRSARLRVDVAAKPDPKHPVGEGLRA
jgi:hypothetical protein